MRYSARDYRALFSVCATVCQLGCASAAPEPESRGDPMVRVPSLESPRAASAVITSSADGSVGLAQYIQTASQMAIGAPVTTTSEFGFQKWTGPEGVIAIKQVNGFELGVPNATSGLLTRPPWGASLQDHNDQVRAYFVGTGLPVAEIGNVQGNVLGSAGGITGQSESPFGLLQYVSRLSRTTPAGVPIAESFAWARINSDGVVVSEEVYWPAIPRATLDVANALQQQLSSPDNLVAFRASMPQGSGRVAIRHSSFAESGPFESYAVFDIIVSDGQGVSVTHHYDSTGHEVRLPQERRSLTGPSRTASSH